MKTAAVWFYCAALAAQTEKGSIEGVVRNSVTGDPLRKAQVTLRRIGPDAAGQTFPAATGPDGRYQFPGLEPGNYIVNGERQGFLRQDDRQEMIKLAPGQKAAAREIKLTPQAVILGRVLDDEGDPVAQVRVEVTRRSLLSPSVPVSQGLTNDVGEFRLAALRPGKYALRASPNAAWAMGWDGPPRGEVAVATYFPGVIDAAQATAITVAAGQEAGGITLRIRKSTVVTVRGKIVILEKPDGAVGDVYLSIAEAPPGESAAPSRSTGIASRRVRADGSFELYGVAPGEYYFGVDQRVGNTMHGARTRVRVGRSDVDGVVLELGNEPKISGVVRWDEAGRDIAEVKGGPLLRASDGAVAGQPGPLAAGGRFSLGTVRRDIYRLGMAGIPPDAYLKQALIGGNDVIESRLDLSNSAGPVELDLVLGAKGASIECSAGEGKQRFFAAAAPDPFTLANSHRMRIADCGPGVACSLRGLAPGAYRVFAAEKLDPASLLDPEVRTAIWDRGKSITVAEGGREKLELTVVAEE